VVCVARPKVLYRVEWDAARRFDTPNDRRRVERNYTTPEAAAKQVRAVRSWPTHMALVAVCRTAGYGKAGLRWEEIDPATLPRLSERDEWRFRRLEEGRLTHPDPAVRRAYYPGEGTNGEGDADGYDD
jgi:hypothetical protein